MNKVAKIIIIWNIIRCFGGFLHLHTENAVEFIETTDFQPTNDDDDGQTPHRTCNAKS